MNEQPLVVHIVFRLDYGGLENGVANLVNGLSGRGFRHAIVALTESTDFARRLDGSVQVYSLHKRPGKDPGAYFRLFRLLRKLKPAVVHTRNVGTLDCAFVAWLAGVPVRMHGEHGWDVADASGTSRKYRFVRRVFSHFVQAFVAVSEEIATWLVSVVGIPESKINRVCNGVDTMRFHPPGRRDRSALPVHLQHPEGIVIGSVTRFSRIKDPLNLVEAFLRLRRDERGDAQPLKLVMIGDGEMHAEAVNLLTRAGAGDDVWLPGSRSDVAALLQTFDVFVLGSLREGISNTVLEAMATGLPIVATATGGNGELVLEAETGFLVPPGDPQALAGALRRYLEDPALRRAHGRAGRARAVERFALDEMIGNYDRLYVREVGLSSGSI